jgi:phosphatidylinositol kinase/protein kinase (PI-3  family)
VTWRIATQGGKDDADCAFRYRKGLDVNTDQLRQHIHEVQEKDWQHPDVLRRWLEQTKRFKPVMRHFFTEKHKDPMGWFAMRLNYTRSVAVTSVVGHILGVGDRHMSNIMIDQVTGEVIHIDFGIVFEDVSGVLSLPPCGVHLSEKDYGSPRRCRSALPRTWSTALA